MPSRWPALTICGFWLLMMSLLFERDVLPHWRQRQAPDFRTVTRSAPVPVRWRVLQNDRRIGSVETEWKRHADGWAEFRSHIELKELPLLSMFGPPGTRSDIRWKSALYVTPDGNLNRFDVTVYIGEAAPTMTVHGRIDGELMRVQFRSGTFAHDEQFYYEPHSLMTTALAPIDRLPHLSVGQRWQERVMNPLRAAMESVQCEVIQEQVITWHGDPEPCFVVEAHYGQMKARSWVSHDGVVLRQEVPLGFTMLVLEHE